MNSSHPFRRLVNNENILKNRVTIYTAPKAKTEKQIHKTILDGYKKQKTKKLELNKVRI